MLHFSPIGNIYYYSGRAVSLIQKPLVIYIFNFFYGNEVATNVALFLFLGPFFSSLCNIDSHRSFYQAAFGTVKPSEYYKTSNAFVFYFCSTLFTQIFGLLIFFVAAWYAFSFSLMLLVIPFFYISERLNDELLRYQIFSKQLDAWGKFSIVRVIFQTLFTALILLFVLPHNPVFGLLLSFVIGSSISYPLVFKIKFNTLKKIIRVCTKVRAKPFFNGIKNHSSLWILSLVSISYSNIDKITAIFIDHQKFAQYSLLVSCFSVMIIVVDYFALTKIRGLILEGKITFRIMLVSRLFYMSLMFALFLSTALSFLVFLYYSDEQYILLKEFILIGLLQFTSTLALCKREFVYWSDGYRSLTIIDLSLLALYAGVGFAFSVLGLTLFSFLALLLFLNSLRFVLYAIR